MAGQRKPKMTEGERILRKQAQHEAAVTVGGRGKGVHRRPIGIEDNWKKVRYTGVKCSQGRVYVSRSGWVEVGSADEKRHLKGYQRDGEWYVLLDGVEHRCRDLAKKAWSL